MRMRATFATLVLTAALGTPSGIVARDPAFATGISLRFGGVSPESVDSNVALEGEADPVPRTVRVDVIATDKSGAAVATLTASDFELREDGAPQSLDEARFIRVDRSLPSERADPIQSDADEQAEAARADTRLFAVYLDEYHVSAANTDRVRAALRQFLDATLNPQDLVVIMRPLDSLFTIRLTRDRVRLRDTIEAFTGRRGDYTPRTQYERNYIAGTPARVEQLRAQVTTSAINALAVHLGSVTGIGRKTLVVVSEGLPRADRRRGLETLPTVDTVIRSANRSNVSIYGVDPREPSVDGGWEPACDQSGSRPPDCASELQNLATATDGRTISGSDLPAAMRAIAADMSAYYLLIYRTGLRQDGKFHDVQVATRKAGVTLRTRKGYWAPISDEELRASLPRPRPPAVVEPPRHISPFITPWFGVSRGADGKTNVTFVWEPASRLPGARQPVPARVVFKALAADGTALFEGPVWPAGPLRPEAGASLARATFDTPPGILRLRMSIENAAEQAIDTDVRDISIRDLSAPVVIGTPEILRARTARDFRAIETDPDAVPVAAREFSRTERLMIRIPAYAPANAAVSLSATLLNRAGKPMRELTIKQTGVASAVRGAIDLPLAGFAPSDYRIEITAGSPAGEAKDLLVFRVTN